MFKYKSAGIIHKIIRSKLNDIIKPENTLLELRLYFEKIIEKSMKKI
jgi:methionine aminopeptidase